MPKVVDHIQYRRDLLRQSLDLFAEKGYGSLTMRQLAEALGVSTGTLYHYFPSKESLFIQLIEELTEQDISNFLSQAPMPASMLAELAESLEESPLKTTVEKIRKRRERALTTPARKVDPSSQE